MIVSQYIYTACGKDRNGAFSVFSKSKDITDAESSEIREVMMYKAPPGLPYEPTEQEIEDKFPKKFGYFLLSSGRACLSQVNYIGRVYSDLDTRWGNYIIHAFVFNANNNFTPYNFIENNVFKRSLTRKEWHDDPIPDDLPNIEISDNAPMLTNDEISGFFTEDRRKKLKFLLEALLTMTNNNPLTFNDDYKNLKYWFKILSLCLPKEIQNKTGICSHFTNTIVPGNISSGILIRANRPDSSQFNYAQEAQRGNFAFDFVNNIIPESINVNKYVKSVIGLIPKGAFEVVKYVENINKIMFSCSVSINEAADLFNLSQNNINSFAGDEEIFNTIMLADKTNFETKTIANIIYGILPQFKFNAQQKLQIYSFIYKNIADTAVKYEIIKIVIDNSGQIGINADKAVLFRDEIKTKANFIFDNYLDYVKSIKILEYIKQTQNSFSKIFLLFDTLVNKPSVKSFLQANNFTASDEINACKVIMGIVLNRQLSENLDLLIRLANASAGNSGEEMLINIMRQIMNDGKIFPNINFNFDILRRLSRKKEFSFDYLLYMIEKFSGQEEFIKIYTNTQNTDNDFFMDFEIANKKTPLFIDFCRKKDAYRFATQPLSVKILKDYFEKYYIIGADTGIFTRRLEEYLINIQAEKRIKECLEIYEILKSDNNPLLIPVYEVYINVIFSLDYDNIYSLCKKQELFEKVLKIYEAVIKAGKTFKPAILEIIAVSISGKILLKYDFNGNNQHVISFFSNNEETEIVSKNIEKIISNKGINIFIDYFFQPVVNICIFGATITEKFDYKGILEKTFTKVFQHGDIEKLSDNIIEGTRQTKTNPIGFILYMTRKRISNSQKPLDKKLGDTAYKYFEKISSGERKKKFSELLEKAEKAEIEQFELFINTFNKEHKSGFLDFLFKK